MIKEFFKLIRISQWIKNFFVFVPLIFSKQLFNQPELSSTIIGFILFCFTSSAIYIVNDIFDVEADKVHPEKKYRPIASGKISNQAAIIMATLFLILVGIISYNFNLQFSLVLLIYFILNLLYSYSIKHIILLDIFSIASGFILRVIGGALIINVVVSSWLILTTMFISLFLAIMKRRSELNYTLGESNAVSRKVLTQYSIKFTEQIASITSSGVIICYALYTVSERTKEIFLTENLVYTLPFVVFGIFRYMFIVFSNKKGENITQILLTDIHMILNILLYILTTIYIIYK